MLGDTESRAVEYSPVWFGWPLGVRFDVEDRDTRDCCLIILTNCKLYFKSVTTALLPLPLQLYHTIMAAIAIARFRNDAKNKKKSQAQNLLISPLSPSVAIVQQAGPSRCCRQSYDEKMDKRMPGSLTRRDGVKYNLTSTSTIPTAAKKKGDLSSWAIDTVCASCGRTV
jgi:hypothetical protein